MGFVLIFIGILLLADPIVGFVDLLPDFFGYLLIYLGTRKLADINPHMEEARAKFRTMLWVGAGQLFAMWFLYSVTDTAENRFEQPAGILLCSFALLFFKWYFLIPSFRELFTGMERLAERYASASLDVIKRGESKSRRMITSFRIFVIGSSIFSVLPELSVLASMEYEVQADGFSFDWYDFIRMFRVIGGFIGLIFCIVWVIRVVLYFIAVFRDREWQKRLQIAYRYEIAQHPGLLTVRRFHLFFLLLQVAILFSLNLRLSYYTALPGAGLALLACLAIWYLSKKHRIYQKKNLYIVGAALAAVSLLQCIFNSWYLSRYLPEASLYDGPDVYYEYLFVRVLGMMEAIATVVFVGLLLRMLMELVVKHTSVEYEHDETHAYSNAATARLHQSFLVRGIVCAALFLVAGIVYVFDAFFLLEFPWVWLIGFVHSFAAIWIFYSILHDFMVQIRFRYQLEPMNKKH